MKQPAVERLEMDELLCLSNCIREVDEYLESNDAKFYGRVGLSCQTAERLRVTVSTALSSRPEYPDGFGPLNRFPVLAHMSLDVISQLSTEELLCFSNCIKLALEYLDHEDQFHTRIGETMEFAGVLRTALETELAKRPENPAL